MDDSSQIASRDEPWSATDRGESPPTVSRDASPTTIEHNEPSPGPPPVDPSPTDPGLRQATADDLGRLRAVLAEAFIQDPMFSWLIPNDGHRQARLRHYFGVELRRYALAHGCVWTTHDLAGAMLG